MGFISLLYRAFALGRQRQSGRLHPLAGERPGAVGQERSRSEQDWQPEGQVPAEQGQPDEYAVPEGDEDWPMLVELCGKVYQAQEPRRGAPLDRDAAAAYQSEMWRVLEGLDAPEWMQEQDDYSEEWA